MPVALPINSIRFAQIEPTTRCDFSCVYCAGRRFPPGDMSLELYETIINSLPGLRYLELQGEGEPLLHPSFFDKVKTARDRKIIVSTITNGNSLNADRSRKMLESGLNTLFISIDTPHPEKFKRIRGGDLHRILTNCRDLIDNKIKLRRKDPSVGFAVTVSTDTAEDIGEIILLYSELGLDGGFIFQPLQKMESYYKFYPENLKNQVPGSKLLQKLERTFRENSTGRYY